MAVATASSPRQRRRRIGAVIAALVLLTVASTAAAVWVRWAREPDPIGDRFLALILPMDTKYAPGYSTAAFRSIELGMSESEVLARLGPPLRKSAFLVHGSYWTPVPSGPEHYAFYTTSPHDGCYWKRIIGYDAAGRVRSIAVGLHVD